jgi:hypothetical protein
MVSPNYRKEEAQTAADFWLKGSDLKCGKRPAIQLTPV